MNTINQITISNSIFDIQNGHHKPGPGCIPALVEDPVRRTYKRLLALTFLASSSLHILLEVVFQVIAVSSVTARRHTQPGIVLPSTRYWGSVYLPSILCNDASVEFWSIVKI